MDNDKHNTSYPGKVVTGNFGRNSEHLTDHKGNLPEKHSNPITKFANPIYEKLFRLTHTQLRSNKGEYISCSGFKPDDID